MAVELFLVPMIGDGSKANPFRGKYTNDPQVTKSGTLRYARIDVAIVLLTAPQSFLNSVASQSDATRLASAPTIDSTINAAQATAAKTVFENAFIPGGFVNAGDVRREVIRTVAGAFLFSQRVEGRFGVGWKAKAQARGINLDSIWSDFPQVLKDEFIDVRDSFGWTNAELGVTNSSTLRQILRAVSDQFQGVPFFIGGFEI